ncbi:MAG: Carbohydrate diacid regulator [Chroococcidiopsis sp. SAG 2025]|uniref:PucR family transcriptional regulator n=1 Tax=Chroococcidiopsis sp. SAG 2025 TaxID=171389 RepID=UPI0029370B56|nr:helix-turn-helix domain-containing protein [Chroococcidiopsis sp. SAG 2025]MDV2992469.1 Carbohydrate diacid regulator [Chroococcidiopsis sp. SAG 2025]
MQRNSTHISFAHTTQFTQVARLVTSKITELLSTQVFVVNCNNIIVASSKCEEIGKVFHSNEQQETTYLRIPLHLKTEVGEVAIGNQFNGETISPRLAKVLVELIINQATVLNHRPNQQALKNQFVNHLLHGQIIDETEILRQAKLLGLDLSPPRAVILIDAAQYVLKPSVGESDGKNLEKATVRQRRRTQYAIGSIVNFFHLPDDTICADLGNGELVVLKASNTKNLGSWAERGNNTDSLNALWTNLAALKRAGDALLMHLRSDTGAAISIGIGRYHPGILGLARSYQDARMALSLGHRFNGCDRVYCLDRLGIAAFIGVADEQTKIELATHLLSPLDCELELLTTVEAFFARDCSPSATAKQLLIHRNTLNYRLDKIASLIGLDPRRFDDAVQIRLALLLRKLQY